MEKVKVKVAMETLILLFLCFFFLIMNLAPHCVKINGNFESYQLVCGFCLLCLCSFNI